MLLSNKTVRILIVSLLTKIPSISFADGNWEKAHRCFNNKDFKCSFLEAKELAINGNIAVGHGEMTTDSMTFYQMAMIEYLKNASVFDKVEAASFTIKVFGKVKRRLPFSVALGYLSLKEATIHDQEIDHNDFNDLICNLLKEVPPPTWRKLNEVKPISEQANSYFDQIIRVVPDC
jgi:hypothetical protein